LCTDLVFGGRFRRLGINRYPPWRNATTERCAAAKRRGLVPDRYPTPSFASIAAVGFALTAYPIGVERGYITRAQAGQRLLATLRFLAHAPTQHGFFYHFLDMRTGARASEREVSTVDTSLLLAGCSFAIAISIGGIRAKARSAGWARRSTGGRTGLDRSWR